MSFNLVLAFSVISVLKICIGQSVKQTEGTVTVIQRSPLWINCSYELSSAYQPSPFWYIQRPGLPPEAFLSHLGNVRLGRDRGFEAKHEPNLKTFHMQKSASHLEDSAVYFCAVSHDHNLFFGPGTKLNVKPDLEDSSPSVYQLMPKHKETSDGPHAQERTAACLFTDYSPNPLKVGINEESMEKINGSVVVVTEDDDDQKGTPSYGIVLWGNNENLDCTAHDKDNNVFRTNPEDPGICSEDDGTTTFETDERLNLLSLSVLGLRIIFFKAIAFNVLLTFHVYSRRVRK